MSRSLRRISRNQEAKKALLDLSKLSTAIPDLQKNIRGVIDALPANVTADEDTQKLLAALVDDCQTLAQQNAILREGFIRLLVVLSGDSEENIRKVEAEIHADLVKEYEGT